MGRNKKKDQNADSAESANVLKDLANGGQGSTGIVTSINAEDMNEPLIQRNQDGQASNDI